MSTPRQARALSITTLVLGAAVACGGGAGGNADTTAAAAAPAATTAAAPSGGEALFQQRCMSCHQANGEGLPGTYPALAGSEYAANPNPAVPIRIVLHGIQGPITVKGTTYNSLMPAYGVGVVMTDDEVASLLTYVRSSWGNSASAVTAAEVAAERAATASHSGAMTAELLAPLMK